MKCKKSVIASFTREIFWLLFTLKMLTYMSPSLRASAIPLIYRGAPALPVCSCGLRFLICISGIHQGAGPFNSCILLASPLLRKSQHGWFWIKLNWLSKCVSHFMNPEFSEIPFRTESLFGVSRSSYRRISGHNVPSTGETFCTLQSRNHPTLSIEWEP